LAWGENRKSNIFKKNFGKNTKLSFLRHFWWSQSAVFCDILIFFQKNEKKLTLL